MAESKTKKKSNMTEFEKALLDRLDRLNKNLEQINETLDKERFDWKKVFEPKPSTTDNDDNTTTFPVYPQTYPTYPQYEKIPYWMQPGFKWPEITCTCNKAND